MLKRWLREPLFHFLIIGAGLFVLFYEVADPQAVVENRIVISESDVDRMIALWERKWQRLPTSAELDGLVEAEIREEILYREALAMGLDDDDTIVRRRMAQKVEFLFEDLMVGAEPTDEELQAFLTDNAGKFTEAARMTFVHVYVNADDRRDAAMEDAKRLLGELRVQPRQTSDPVEQGDPFMFGYAFEDQSEHHVARMFGSDFAQALSTVEPGVWQGPVESGYGLHLVYVEKRTEPRLLALSEIRDRVKIEFLAVRQREANKAFYDRLRQRYEIVIEKRGEGGSDARAVASAESLQ